MDSYEKHDEGAVEGLELYYRTSLRMDCRNYVKLCTEILSLIAEEREKLLHTMSSSRAVQLQELEEVYLHTLEDCLDWMSQSSD